MESAPQPGLRRVEDAMRLLKRYGPLHYLRVIRHLDRIWVWLLADAHACYQHSLKACVFDERFILDEATTLERIATTIVHEATHARLAQWGVSYDEKLRPRIEAICLRRELTFAAKLPDNPQLQDELARTLEWCVTNPDDITDANFRERDRRGEIESLHHVGTPEWLVQTLSKLRAIVITVRKLVRRIARAE